MDSEDPKLADGMSEYAEQAILTAKKHHQLDLDYSVDSIEALEKLLDSAARLVHQWKYRIFRRTQREQLSNRLALVYGAYLGEVIRKTWGGTWSGGKEPPFDGIACLTLTSGLKMAPTARAYKQITKPDSNTVVSYVEAIPSMIEESESESD